MVELVREQVSGELQLSPLRSDQLPSRLEILGTLWRHAVVKDKVVIKPHLCSKAIAELLLGSREATESLYPISMVVGSPVLFAGPNGENVVLGEGYHREGNGILVTKGKAPPLVQLDEATGGLLDLLEDFAFELPSDRARALAMMLTPALVWGGHLGKAYVPMFLIGADRSQAGKNLLSQRVGSVYDETLIPQSPRKGGVGSFDEDFNAMLFKGKPLILLDNLREKLDSTYIESFLTARGPFLVRTPHRAAIEIDASKYIVIGTSNGFQTTPDLENRLLRIQIRKRPASYRFKLTPDRIARKQSFYLGCVFSILQHWLAQGCPRTRETRHSFREWAQTLDWILRNVFKGKLEGRMLDDYFPAKSQTNLAADFGFEPPDDNPE